MATMRGDRPLQPLTDSERRLKPRRRWVRWLLIVVAFLVIAWLLGEVIELGGEWLAVKAVAQGFLIGK